ncbi:hypothetical protein CHGG_09259 [Chaetomium globosum CBS 148.51]|uniref:Uncharacterized protein n=1 Tax=Chaetomium globosum (strain ATCC 6205 / CBS 148.51 / DSM 1962 / NBRC 6347 / NRRL 1970) TaxID=306901 RepID=Q2GRZ5_CHAGB|nr:uncharacterized protein CHGG_09259 [Chaetomium globosum CBS 148.51]EAQ85245.1 hypothetical protein CHGG_09259 [Chaetomium globosum CBS 148.51]
MAPRRTPRRPAGTSAPTPDTSSNPSNSSTATKKNTTSTTAPTSTPRVTYESHPVPQQVTFPARRKTVRTYGGRRSLPARLETTTTPPGSNDSAVAKRRGMRGGEEVKGLQSGGEGGGMVGEEEVEEEEDVKMEVVKVVAKKAAPERRSKRRRTMGDVPTPRLEKKGSSFHTQTLTQFMGASATKLEYDGLRVEDDEEDVEVSLPSGRTPIKQSSVPRWKGKGKAAAPEPCTPSNKRIKVNPDEVPASQPTPFTPLLGHSPLAPMRSPLTQKSTNIDAPLPTIETVSKIPRTLTIQDSYSMGDSSSLGFPSSAAGDTPKKEETQQSTREPLSEIPVASIELGVGSTPAGETPTSRRKRMFFEIPDTDDELDGIASTPFKTSPAQQTPLKQEVIQDNFEIAADPGSAPRTQRTAISETPVSSAKSDKENGTPAIGMWEDRDMDYGAEEREGTPTPTPGRKSQAASRTSQVSPNTASQFWTGSAENNGSIGTSAGVAREPLTELALREDSVEVEDDQSSSPPSTPLASQFYGSMGKSDARTRRPSLQFEDPDETASEAEEDPVEEDQAEEEPADEEQIEEEHIPVSILKKAASQKDHCANGRKRRGVTPNLNSESLTTETPSTPTRGTPAPAVRRVQIELPPPSSREVYKETPRKPQKSSPIYQRHTQARSQFYSQGLESQRIPLEVIRSLGPQTDRSDILTVFPADIVEGIVNGLRDHEFRDYKFPVQVSRCWIYTDLPAGEVKYMATLGPAKEPGQIDAGTGVGNAEFNAGTSGYKFAHKLVQVYQLNNPVPLADMEDNGLGAGPPQRYKYLPPAIVGQLLANLRCPLFCEEYEEDFSCGDFLTNIDQGGVTISQELEDQLRSDILHSTQKPSRAAYHHDEEEDVIPASQSPTQPRSAPIPAQKANGSFTRPPIPARSSPRIRDHQSSQTSAATPRPKPPRQPTPARTTTARRPPSSTSQRSIRPSQATTASDISAVSSPDKSSGPPSVPRPPLPGSNDMSLPSLPDDDDHASLLPRPRPGLLLSSSQGGVLPPDSLFVDEVSMAPPPVEVWDSDSDGDGDEVGGY